MDETNLRALLTSIGELADDQIPKYIREKNYAELKDKLLLIYDYLQAIQLTLTHEYGHGLQLKMDIFPVFTHDPEFISIFAESKMRFAYPQELLCLHHRVIDRLHL